MRYRRLGHSGLHVSVIGLGSWLTFGSSVDRDTARACVVRAWEGGVNFIDTANVYARGAAEETLGPIVQELDRGALILATKAYFPMGDSIMQRGLSRKHLRDQLDGSLRRLRVDYVDLYQCHRYDETTPLEETCAAMNDFVRQGKILYWGVSEWNADRIAAAAVACAANGWAAPVSNQPQYSALWRRVETRVLPVCAEYGLGNVVWSPLAMGILTGKYVAVDRVPAGTRAAGPFKDMMEDYFTPPVLEAVQRVVPLARDAGCSMAQLALAWCLRRPEVSSAIVGATKLEHLEDNLAAGDLDVDPAVFAALDRILEPVSPSEPYMA